MNYSYEITNNKAITNSNNFKSYINNILEYKGYKLNVDYFKNINIGKTIYNTKRRVDFYIINNNKYKNGIIIECKWQQVRGTVDEKFPYLLLNIESNKIPTIVVLDGNGYKKESKNWFKTKVHETNYLIDVVSMCEFQTLCNNDFV